MENKQHNAKYAFYYLLSLAALIFVAIGVVLIAFGIIDRSLPDALISTYRAYNEQFRFALSALIIAAPTYYVSVYLINKGLKKKELDLNSALRRWLTYFILLVSGVTILGTLVGILNNFLGGSLSWRFLLQFLSVLAVAALIFFFYLYDIKREEIKEKDKKMLLFTIISGALALAAIISVFFFMESPQMARARRLDQNLMNNIYQLEGEINNFYTINKRLPESLPDLMAQSSRRINSDVLLDPTSGKMIEYRRDGDKAFSLCADFRLSSEQDDPTLSSAASSKAHMAGYDCVKGEIWENDLPEKVR